MEREHAFAELEAAKKLAENVRLLNLQRAGFRERVVPFVHKQLLNPLPMAFKGRYCITQTPY